ncbi:MAG: hybrid sensor histidine kinase/response regulator [Bryobacteraceae bacterium]|jgi:two-component system chemotaxis sensor kinase CheA
MSDFAMDDELVLDYLAESREHLATIENDLLLIEQAGAAIDEQLVNRVFRAAHSIKGGAGFFDLLTIKELAHKTESVLEMVRSRQMVPNPEVVSILLLAFDKLRDLIGNYTTSNEADTSDFLVALTSLTGDHLSADRKTSLHDQIAIPVPNAKMLIQVSAFDLAQARQGGKRIFLIQCDLIHDIQRQGKTPLDVLRKLIDCGSILETAFDLDSAGTLDDEPSDKLLLDVLYATALDSYSIGNVLHLRPDRIRVIEPTDTEKPLAEVAAEAVDVPVLRIPVLPISVAPEHVVSEQINPVSRPATSLPALQSAALQAAAPQPTSAQVDATIRLNVGLLDSLMILAGELVLSRNQLNEAVAHDDAQGVRAGAHRVSLVTSELQEAVSLTRMQPVGSLFAKFPRLVRDLADELGKEVQLQTEGGDVELDKTILEGLSDPLTHMVRNSVDHGIELPSVRVSCNKPALGTITLRARHQAGQVVIEISDDGKGLAVEKIAASSLAKGMVTAEQLLAMSEYEKLALIFLPGVSTAEKVSNTSGRGVGMDVVKTNLDKLGGKVEIVSTPGKGSSFLIKLPLTLAIIPSLLVSSAGERFAIPQVSVGELIRIPKDQIADRIDRAGDAEIVLVRDKLFPLVHLADALGIPRPERGSKALNVVLVDAGAFEYGLAVEDLHDTVEIVVKPMGRHLQGIRDYAGATILGDGQVAVILDVAGLAVRAGLSGSNLNAVSQQVAAGDAGGGEVYSLLLFHNGPSEPCAVPIELVTRVERVRPAQVEYLGGRRTMQYGGASLPLVTLHDVASVGDLAETQQWVVIVFERAGSPVGLVVAEPLDMVETQLALDTVTLRQPGIAGSAIINSRATLMLDIFELAETVRRRWPEREVTESSPLHLPGKGTTVLVADDSDFFRGQIKRLIEAVGYKVMTAADGEAAWEMLDGHANEISVVTTDVEMPRLDGLGLTKRIRGDARFVRLPVIALSSLAGEDEMARGLAMGVSEYQVKLDQDQLLESIRKAVNGISLNQSPVTA